MSYRTLILTVFALVIGLGAATVAMANPTCQCDVICDRVEQRCLNLGGTLDQCAEAYNSCFITCGDTWPCGSTCADGSCPPQPVSEGQTENILGIKIPFWLTSDGELANHVEAAEEAPESAKTSGASQNSD